MNNHSEGCVCIQCELRHRTLEYIKASKLPESDQAAQTSQNDPINNDPINRPAHYITPSGLELVDVLEAFNLNMHRGTAVAYILRAGRKGGPEQEVQDLQKAHRWLGREINRLQGKREW